MATPFQNPWLGRIWNGLNPGIQWLQQFNLIDDLAGNSWGQVDLAATSDVAGTYSSSAQTLTVTAAGATTVDSVVLTAGLRVLLQNQTTTTQKGIYTVTVAGAGSVHTVLTRTVDAAATGDFQQGKIVSVRRGTANIGKSYICTFALGFVLDTGSPVFTVTSAVVTFASVQSALAAATGAVDFNAQALTGTPSISGASGVAIKIGATTVMDVGTTSATAVTLAANKSLVGAAGSGAVTLGSMTGDMTLPTGALSWAGAANKALSLVATTAAVTITAAAASVWKTTVGALRIDAATALNLGTTDATSVVTGKAGIANSSLGMKNQTVGAVLAVAGNAIAITANIHHVGAGLIKNITVPATIVAGAVIQLIPDVAYTYDATGNIVVPAGGGTAVVNKVMTLVYDGAVWTPSY